MPHADETSEDKYEDKKPEDSGGKVSKMHVPTCACMYVGKMAYVCVCVLLLVTSYACMPRAVVGNAPCCAGMVTRAQ
jgi:hypothetical protein